MLFHHFGVVEVQYFTQALFLYIKNCKTLIKTREKFGEY